VFKEINNNWNYVSDPKGREYIASASESVKYLSGDCDDHSILMAACIRSIGGIPRLIHTDGHIYPEILIGNKVDLETINYLVKKVLFPDESKGKSLHYHIDERGNIWLNLDYTAKYPGGPFMNEEILSALTLN
jgi:transglutaminase-like putative cysteine protease